MTSMSDYFPIIYIYQQLGDFLKIVVKHAVNADFLKFPFVKVACYVFGYKCNVMQDMFSSSKR